MLDPDRAFPTTRDGLFERLISVTNDLIEVGRAQFDAESTLRIERDQALMEASDAGVTTASMLDKHADHHTLTQKNTAEDLRSQRQSYAEERDLIQFLLEQGWGDATT